jgi:hypothetical protein
MTIINLKSKQQQSIESLIEELSKESSEITDLVIVARHKNGMNEVMFSSSNIEMYLPFASSYLQAMNSQQYDFYGEEL